MTSASGTTAPTVLWFRRDLRLSDHPALLAAARGGAGVVGLFVVDPALWRPSARARYLTASLTALHEAMAGRLVIRTGDPAVVVPAVATEVSASSVHISADCAPYGRRRDARVARMLASFGVRLLAHGSPYAIGPGVVVKPDGSSYRVFTPFYRAWQARGWPSPAPEVADPRWLHLDSEPFPGVPDDSEPAPVPAAGEAAAMSRWQHFRAGGLADYHEHRDRADLDGSSRLSAALRFGELHPRTLLAELDDSAGAEAFRRELAFRDFYADVLWHRPDSAHTSLDSRFDTAMVYDSGSAADAAFDAWRHGRTGFPFVDAGMRQLLATGWMHNRVRMVVASFLVKDLHLPWWRGAQWFMARLHDGDVASNSAGWQWTAGCGTDAAPYFRVFNPVTQGKKFDPRGDYVRRWVPELRSLPGSAVHEPWKQPLLAPEYPAPIVDHAAERLEALARFETMRAAAG